MKMDEKQQEWLSALRVISGELFRASLITYLMLLILENLREGLVSYNLNINFFLSMVLISGFVYVVFTRPDPISKSSPTPWEGVRNWVLIIAATAIVGVIVFLISKSLGKVSWLLSTVAMMIVFLLATIAPMDDSSGNDTEEKDEYR